ncbi:uncharacterized protein LOC117896645 [Drosophila subobscura]|uniref:uncharacterized protein LOC117896645 n=1 Tax=Drosophila subobscura TaxID=7241 RepID=UPI00155AFC86|nr:uncharacterized protein LOC117896645 [Drosophila subobscura]
MIRYRGCCLSAFLVMFFAVENVLSAPIGTPLDMSDRYVTFDLVFESNDLPLELDLQLLQKLQSQNGLDVVRMQLLQLNLMKLLVVLDIFILLCVFFYARDSSHHQIQIVS